MISDFRHFTKACKLLYHVTTRSPLYVSSLRKTMTLTQSSYHPHLQNPLLRSKFCLILGPSYVPHCIPSSSSQELDGNGAIKRNLECSGKGCSIANAGKLVSVWIYAISGTCIDSLVTHLYSTTTTTHHWTVSTHHHILLRTLHPFSRFQCCEFVNDL